jgi:hypothetical protein
MCEVEHVGCVWYPLQADKLVNKSSFPDTASNNQYARYFYYLGKIKSTQLEYTEAQKYASRIVRLHRSKKMRAGGCLFVRRRGKHRLRREITSGADTSTRLCGKPRRRGCLASG